MTYYQKNIDRLRIKYRDRYQQKKKSGVCGIYKIINKTNGKYYVGSSAFIESRFITHKRLLNNNNHRNPHLQNAWNKYGENAFDFLIVENVIEEKLIDTEQKYIDDAHKNGDGIYNINKEAGRTVLSGYKHPQWGKHHSEKTRKHWSKIRKGMGTAHADKTIYTFRNLNTNETLIGTRCDLHYKYDVDFAGISRIVSGERKQYCQWCLSL